MSNRIPLKKVISGQYWDKNQIAWFFGVSEDAVRRWRELPDDPIPSIGTGQARQFDIFVVVEWHERYKKRRWQQQKAKIKNQTAKSNLPEVEESQQRLEHYRAELQAIKLKEAQKDLIPTELVQSAIAAIISQTRTDILSVPNRMRGKHGDTVYNDAKDFIDSALKNMSTKLTDLNFAALTGGNIPEDETGDA